jgi:hypothetical protein
MHETSSEAQFRTTLRRIWQIPDLQATHSLLRSNQVGNVLLAVKKSGRAAWDLCAVDVKGGRPNWCSPLTQRAGIEVHVAGNKAVVADSSRNVTAYDLESGQKRWQTRLECDPSPGGGLAVNNRLLLMNCHVDPFDKPKSGLPDVVALDLENGRMRWRRGQLEKPTSYYLLDGKLLAGDLAASRPEAFPLRVIDIDSGEDHPSTALSAALAKAQKGTTISRCPSFFDLRKDGIMVNLALQHRPCSTAFETRGMWTGLEFSKRVCVGNRIFDIGCEEISEVDSIDGRRVNRWPVKGWQLASAPPVLALEADGPRLTLVLASVNDQRPGRVVAFDGSRLASVQRAPRLDPDLVALMGGVLVVQEEKQTADAGAENATALVGYSVAEARDVNVDAELETAKVRELLSGSPPLFERFPDRLDSLPALKLNQLKAMTRWEDAILPLLDDQDGKAQTAAMAIAVQVHTPTLQAELLRLLAPPVSREFLLTDLAGAWNREATAHRHFTRLNAAAGLLMLHHRAAIPALTQLMIEVPYYDPENPMGSTEVPREFCRWVSGMNPSEARPVIEAFDRSLRAEGAWHARCSTLLGQ